MVHTHSTHPTTVSGYTQRGFGGFHISDPNKYCREVDLLLRVARAKGYRLPTEYQLRLLNSLVCDLIQSGIWATYDLLYVFAYESLLNYGDGIGDADSNPSRFPTSLQLPEDTIQNFTLLNIKNPLQYECTIVRSSTRPNIPYYTSQGWKYRVNNPTDIGQGALNTNWVPGTNGVNWTQNNAGAVFYQGNLQDTSAGTTFPLGCRDTTVNRTALEINLSNASNNCVGIVNAGVSNGNFVTDGSQTTSIGHHRVQRMASNQQAYYRDGTQRGSTGGLVSQTMTGTIAMHIGTTIRGTSLNQPNLNPMPYCAFGSSLSTTLIKVEYDIFRNYLNKTGLQ